MQHLLEVLRHGHHRHVRAPPTSWWVLARVSERFPKVPNLKRVWVASGEKRVSRGRAPRIPSWHRMNGGGGGGVYAAYQRKHLQAHVWQASNNKQRTQEKVDINCEGSDGPCSLIISSCTTKKCSTLHHHGSTIVRLTNESVHAIAWAIESDSQESACVPNFARGPVLATQAEEREMRTARMLG